MFRRVDKANFNTARMLTSGFFMVILLGALMLMLPCATVSGESTDFITALFTATTSVCVTGLVVVPTFAYWSMMGKIVILILIQLGGLGIICIAVGFFIIVGKRISLKERKLIQESYNLDTGKGVIKIIRSVFAMTFTFEGIGALLYSIQFVPEYGVERGIWYSIFHSVSAFCNAGIDVIGPSSFEPYKANVLVNLTTMGLIVCSGIGFVVWLDIVKIIKDIKNKEYSINKFFERMSLHTKIAVTVTLVLIFAGGVIILLFEYNNNGTIGDMKFGHKVMASLFESVTLRTAGFLTVPQVGFREGTFIILCIWMLIGGSPMGTAGGIKTTTIAMILLSVKSTITGKTQTEAFRRKLSQDNIRSAIAVFVVAVTVLFAAIIALTFTESATLKQLAFEAFSAMGTVGLTMDLTPTLSSAGRLIIITLMFFGRVGPITIAMAFANKNKNDKHNKDLPEKRILIG